MAVEQTKISLTSDGSSTTGYVISGKVLYVIIDLTGPTSADVKITPSLNTGTNFEIFNIASITADNIYFPSAQLMDKAGSGKSFYVPYPVSDKLTVTLANLAGTGTVDVYIGYDKR